MQEKPVKEHFSSELARKDPEFELGLRPSKFRDFIGQTKVKERLELFVEAARGRKDVLEHVLLAGPPGLGKTTLAYILANAMGVNIRATSGPIISKPGDLAGILTSVEQGDIVFIDEIHRIQKSVEEYLYAAMEDFVIDIMIDQGPNSRSVRLNLPKFTLVGATTRSGLLSKPLRSRFGLNVRLDYYPADELQSVIRRSARILDVDIDDEGAREIAGRSRGTPRIANRLLRRVRDFSEVGGHKVVSRSVADQALTMLNVDPLGLDEMDRRILLTLIEKFQGGPIGLETLSTAVCEEKNTLEDVYEPFLIQSGFLIRTPRGRMATVAAYEHFGLPVRAGASPQPGLFDDLDRRG